MTTTETEIKLTPEECLIALIIALDRIAYAAKSQGRDPNCCLLTQGLYWNAFVDLINQSKEFMSYLRAFDPNRPEVKQFFDLLDSAVDAFANEHGLEVERTLPALTAAPLSDFMTKEARV